MLFIQLIIYVVYPADTCLCIQLILYCVSNWYYSYVVYSADTIVTVIVSTQCIVFMISVYFVWYVSVNYRATSVIFYKILITLCFSMTTIYFLNGTSICNSYTWYPINLYIRPTVYRPSAWCFCTFVQNDMLWIDKTVNFLIIIIIIVSGQCGSDLSGLSTGLLWIAIEWHCNFKP